MSLPPGEHIHPGPIMDEDEDGETAGPLLQGFWDFQGYYPEGCMDPKPC